MVVFHVPHGFGDELAHNGPFDERRRPIDVTVIVERQAGVFRTDAIHPT